MSAILEEEFQSKLDLALSLLQDLADIEQKGVSGVNKLRSKIEQDLVFLNKVKQSGNLKKEHLASSNIHHYSAIVSYVKQSENCVSLLEVFKYEDEDAGKKKISVDVVSCGKSKWTKVIARNPKALSQILKDKELYACKTAVEKFQGIVDAIGGPGEQQRAKSLSPRIHVVDDVPCTSLSLGGQIKSRSLIIFGTGQAIHAITVTANTSFVRAAQQQGVRFDVLFHEARALTERKEIH
ncbi:unnamed protein product [Nesidiocoris tenuis]|uniref:DUF1308 domain-containing protein n=1 Tax=Nesidiocoris tenuis TaxID=355587 RepID=A0A6H5GGS7_9HEMI|nr:unnamed protein product [Nesidiocoris tenuis]